MLSRALFLPLAAFLILTGCSPATRDGTEAPSVTVLAAASLTDALTEIAQDYEARTGVAVRVSFASSSTLARQIEAGAPADIFASADRAWMDYLDERGLIDPASRAEPIGNALALIAPADFPANALVVDAALDLPALLGPDGRLAVGDPDHVPAGAYARQALTHLGLWEAAEPRLARAEDVRGALALVARGEAPLGIVYATDAAIDPQVRAVGLFPDDSHEPVVYPFALLAGERPDAAREFFNHATGEDVEPVWRRYGFAPR